MYCTATSVVTGCMFLFTSKAQSNIFWTFFFTPKTTFREKKIIKKLILAFEENRRSFPNLHFFLIFSYYGQKPTLLFRSNILRKITTRNKASSHRRMSSQMSGRRKKNWKQFASTVRGVEMSRPTIKHCISWVSKLYTSKFANMVSQHQIDCNFLCMHSALKKGKIV